MGWDSLVSDISVPPTLKLPFVLDGLLNDVRLDLNLLSRKYTVTLKYVATSFSALNEGSGQRIRGGIFCAQNYVGVVRGGEFKLIGCVIIDCLNEIVLFCIRIYNPKFEFVSGFSSVNSVVVAPRFATEEFKYLVDFFFILVVLR